ncbi:Hsp20/alpha crystallin family protein [Fulvivirga imtechensis]|uniref:Hsp20/alpha crystallin family protein n=1 Tax=Fulvivirga imtechensis TaxID=881893 RepID=UPI001FE0D099|nr:Hsp20/alpha crystallin family protein [Fulvivirga imtechensis]
MKPKTGVPGFFTDWLHPDSIFNRDVFDIESMLALKPHLNLPPVNIKETSKEFTLELAAPGLERKDFKIEVENNNLRISVEKREEKREGKESENYWRREYSYQTFSRSFALPEGIKEDKIDARYANGLLTLHLPKEKVTAARPAHKIAVT